MSSDRSLSELAAGALRVDAQRAAPVTPAKRAQAIEGMVSAMRRRKRGRRAGIAAGACLALAASVVLAIGAQRAASDRSSGDPKPVAVSTPAASPAVLHGHASIVRAGAPAAVDGDREALAAGDRIDVPQGGSAIVSLANGTEVSARAGTSYLLLAFAPTTTFELATGSIHADVAKLALDERFVVRTADAEIEVRGTSFDVSRVPADPACGNGTTTRVTVREGTVLVRSQGTESLVHPDEVWPPGCETKAKAEPSVVAPGATARRASVPARSDLAAQNDLFERAVAKKRAGDAPGAIAGFDQLLARHPSSHLAQSARAERMKLLRGVDRERARAAARDYLQRYPAGFARADADVILASPE